MIFQLYIYIYIDREREREREKRKIYKKDDDRSLTSNAYQENKP